MSIFAEEIDDLLVKRVTGRGLESMQETKYNIAKCGERVAFMFNSREPSRTGNTRRARRRRAGSGAGRLRTSWHYNPFWVAVS